MKGRRTTELLTPLLSPVEHLLCLSSKQAFLRVADRPIGNVVSIPRNLFKVQALSVSSRHLFLNRGDYA